MFTLFKTGLSIFVTGMGIIILIRLGKKSSGPLVSRVLHAGSVMLMVVGFIGIAGMIFLGYRTGDFEWWAVPLNGLFIFQGILTYTWFGNSSGHILLKPTR